MELGLSIAFVVLVIVCRGLSSYFIEGNTLPNAFYDLKLMLGNILIMVVVLSLITVALIAIYRK